MENIIQNVYDSVIKRKVRKISGKLNLSLLIKILVDSWVFQLMTIQGDDVVSMPHHHVINKDSGPYFPEAMDPGGFSNPELLQS